jgi:hypothetical protein
MRPPASKVACGIAASLLVVGVAVVIVRGRSATRGALTAARPAIDGLLATVHERRFGDLPRYADASFVAESRDPALRAVVDGMDAVLGQRTSLAEPSARLAGSDGRRLAVSVEATHERGPAVLDVALERGDDGEWRVSHFAARSAAFVWVLR